MKQKTSTIEYPELQNILPQAYPFLLIDRVEDYTIGQSLTAVKNITANDWVFQTEEPSLNDSDELQPYPETLLIEAAAQAALVLHYVSKVKYLYTKPKYILGKIKAEFQDVVLIGDYLKIQTFASKMLDFLGYMDICMSKNFDTNIANIQIVYSVRYENKEFK